MDISREERNSQREKKETDKNRFSLQLAQREIQVFKVTSQCCSLKASCCFRKREKKQPQTTKIVYQPKSSLKEQCNVYQYPICWSKFIGALLHLQKKKVSSDQTIPFVWSF